MFKLMRMNLLSAGLACFILLLCCTACGKTKESETADPKLWKDSKLAECQLWIHNTSCPESLQVRTVPDDSLRKEIAGLCEKAEPFRPLTSWDTVLGVSSEPWLVFRDGEITYTFSFRDSEKQLAFDAPNRDKPLIAVAVQAEKGQAGTGADGQGWYYSLSAMNYATLYEMLFTYAGGEVVRLGEP